MVPSYQLKIITPQGTAYQGEVRHARIPAEDGFVGVLAHHAPYVTSSSGGLFEVDEIDGKKKLFRVGQGFFSVAQNNAAFLTDSFEFLRNGN